MKNFFFNVIVFLLFVGNSKAQTGNALSLQQCIEIANKNNLDVKQSELQMQTSKINWNQARLNLLPGIFGNAVHGINQGRSIDPFTNSYINQQVNFASYDLTAGVVLFNGFGLQSTVRQNELGYEASKMEWQQSKDNLMLNIIAAYLQVLSGNDLLEDAQNRAAVTGKQVERLEVLNKQGAIVPSQLFDLKGQAADDQVSIINAEQTLDEARLTLCQLMNVPYDKNLEVQPITAEFTDIYNTTPDQIYEVALQQLALVKATDLRKQSAEKGLAAVRGNYYPSLSLNGSVNTNYSSVAQQDVFQNTSEVASGDYVEVDGNKLPVITSQSNFATSNINYKDQLNHNLNTSVSLSLSIPIFNRLQARNNVALARINVENEASIAQTAKIQLKQAVEHAYFNMTTAYNRYTALNEQVTAFAESFRESEVRFNSGAITSVDYLVSKNNLDRASINRIIAKYDYILRTKILDYYQGKQSWNP